MTADHVDSRAESSTERCLNLRSSMEALGEKARSANRRSYWGYHVAYDTGMVGVNGECWMITDNPLYSRANPAFIITANPPDTTKELNYLVTIRRGETSEREEGEESLERGSEFGLWRFHSNGEVDKIIAIPVEDIKLSDTFAFDPIADGGLDGMIWIKDKEATDPPRLSGNLDVLENGVKALSDKIEACLQLFGDTSTAAV